MTDSNVALLSADMERGRIGDLEYYTVDQVADLLGRNVQLVRRWIREGRLEAERVGPIYLIRPGALRRFKVPQARPRRRTR